MRKALKSLALLTVKLGTPLVVCGSTAIYIKNKVTGVREPVTLGSITKSDNKRKEIVVIGGGLSGLATAYYLVK